MPIQIPAFHHSAFRRLNSLSDGDVRVLAGLVEDAGPLFPIPKLVNLLAKGTVLDHDEADETLQVLISLLGVYNRSESELSELIDDVVSETARSIRDEANQPLDWSPLRNHLRALLLLDTSLGTRGMQLF